jgi:hypothetical protein
VDAGGSLVIVAFEFPNRTRMEYGTGDARVPAVGERVHFDGSDPIMAPGIWRVLDVEWVVSVRGFGMAVVRLGRS